MSWRFLFSLLFALAYLAWILKGRKAQSRAGQILFLAGLAGILIHLSCAYIQTRPVHAPLRTVVGLATNRSVSRFDLGFDRHRSVFMLIEDKTDRRILFSTEIEGPWSDKPIRATFVDDGRFMPSVVRIEILRDDRLAWKVDNEHVGWAGTAEAKRRAPLMVEALGFLLMIVGAFAPTTVNHAASDGAAEGNTGIAVE